ncbi:MAG: hypothetical protein HY741_02130 [Chloroflexi bacterium]|nr:hypothetical protein [Chloroflexota bacterium]
MTNYARVSVFASEQENKAHCRDSRKENSGKRNNKVVQQPKEEKSGEESNPLEPRYNPTLFAISTGTLAGGVIGVVLGDAIVRGEIRLAVFLIIAILLLADYRGRTRVIRLIAATIVAALFVIFVLLSHRTGPGT